MLDYYRKKPSPALLHALTLTLDHMARGGMYDQVAAASIATAPTPWLVPHFEKMLYDNALEPQFTLKATRVTQNRGTTSALARETLEASAVGELHYPTGKAFSAGARWTRTARARKAASISGPPPTCPMLPLRGTPSGAADAQLFCRVYNVAAEGNFHGPQHP